MNGFEDRTVFFTVVSRAEQIAGARLLIQSIRSFGGAFRGCPVWVFEANPHGASCGTLSGPNVHVLPLNVPEKVRHNWFSGKVYACSQAEERVDPGVESLVWMSHDSLVIQPPVLFDLGDAFDAAVRPVHIRNVGLLTTEPVNGFWKGVYEAAGGGDVDGSVETFVDEKVIRPYYNTHAMAVNPRKGLFGKWFEKFSALVCDESFQSKHCVDVRNRIFLHQAVWSALLVASVEPQRILMLPWQYSYPYNLHQDVPLNRRAGSLNELVSIACEERPLAPELVTDIEIREPLLSWLSDFVSEN